MPRKKHNKNFDEKELAISGLLCITVTSILFAGFSYVVNDWLIFRNAAIVLLVIFLTLTFINLVAGRKNPARMSLAQIGWVCESGIINILPS